MEKNKLNRNDIEVLLSKLNESLQLEKFSKAELVCKQILDLDAGNILVHEILGDLYLRSMNVKDATEIFKRSIELNSNQANIFYKLGICYATIDQHKEALGFYEKAIELREGFYEAIYNAANSLFDLKEFQRCIDFFNKFIKLNPTFPDAYLNKGLAYVELLLPKEAITSFNEAIKINPKYAEAYNNRGNALRDLKLFNEALESFNEAIKISPNYIDAISNRGVIYRLIKRDDLAISDFNSANTREALFNLSLIHLSNLNFKEGWPLYKHRTVINDIEFDEIEDGCLINATSILIYAEQGVGDQVLFLSALNYLEPFHKKISVFLDSRLIPLFERSFRNIKFISELEKINKATYEKIYLSGDVLSHFINGVETLKINKPFLISNLNETIKIREKLKNTKKIICGISWVSQNNRIGEYKSINLQCLSKILKMPNLIFVNLQYGNIKDELKNVKENLKIDIIDYDSIDNTKDIDMLASLVDACDIVLTISNFTAHLSGALGKKTFLMLPYNSGKLWYWHSNSGVSYWYPSIKIFQQKKFDRWESMIEEVYNELAEFLSFKP